MKANAVTSTRRHLHIVIPPLAATASLPAAVGFVGLPTRETLIEQLAAHLKTPASRDTKVLLTEAAGDGSLLPAEADLFKLLGHIVNNAVESGDIEGAKDDLRECIDQLTLAHIALDRLGAPGARPLLASVAPSR